MARDTKDIQFRELKDTISQLNIISVQSNLPNSSRTLVVSRCLQNAYQIHCILGHKAYPNKL